MLKIIILTTLMNTASLYGNQLNRINSRPLIYDTTFSKFEGADNIFNTINFELLYTIDIKQFDDHFIKDTAYMAADSNANLYVLDYLNKKISVFNSEGKFIKDLINAGQKKHELNYPFYLAIKSNVLYVVELKSGLKMWNLDGKFINYIPFGSSNLRIRKVVPFDSGFLSFEEQVNHPNGNRFISDITFTFNSYEELFGKKSEVVKIDVSNNERMSHQLYSNWAVSSEGNLYVPKSYQEYSILKIDINGKLVNTIEKSYQNKKYSEEIRKFYQNQYGGKAFPELNEYPPVVRNILVDDFNNLWVTTGESAIDTREKIPVQNTIDIFNKKGDFVYSFENSIITPRSFIKDNRLYIPPKKSNGYQIQVYRINYLNQQK